VAARVDPNSPLAPSHPLFVASRAPLGAALPRHDGCRAAVKVYNLSPAMAKVVGAATATRAVCMQKL